MKNHYFDGVESIRIRLRDRISGPFTRLLIRPMPEVELLGQGRCSVVIRGNRVNQIVPLVGHRRSCYYAARQSSGWEPEDFKDSEWAGGYVGRVERVTSKLAIPVGHVRLDTQEKLFLWVNAHTPWNVEAVQSWFNYRKTGAWLTVMRVYSMDPVELENAESPGLGRVHPFIAKNVRPVLEDTDWNNITAQFKRTVGQKIGENNDPHAALAEEEHLGHSTHMVGYTKEDLERWHRLLKRKKALIFHGAPGTGKTYIGKEFAKGVVGGDLDRIETVQFHPGFSYEDFIQGIRPRSVEGHIHYELTDGIFLRFCKKADRDRNTPYVFFIDELNRASLPRVFGELNFLLEYRRESITLSGGGAAFKLPPNVYIVATMNEADRSISSIDQALIRRFSFVYLGPNYKAIKEYFSTHGLDSVPLITLLKEINGVLASEDVQLGISFFLQDGAHLPEVLADIWIGEVEPYLKNSFYGRQEVFQQYRWEGVKDRLASTRRS